MNREVKSLCSWSFHSREVNGQQIHGESEGTWREWDKADRGSEAGSAIGTGCSGKTSQRWHWSRGLKKYGIGSQEEGTASEGPKAGACLAWLSGGTARCQCGWRGSPPLHLRAPGKPSAEVVPLRLTGGGTTGCRAHCWPLYIAGAC